MAGLAVDPRSQWDLMSVRYSSDNLGVGDLVDILDIITSSGGFTMSDYRLLDRLTGRTTRVGGSAMVGYRGGNWAVGAYAQAISGFSVENVGAQELRLVAYGLDVTSYGGAYADALTDDLWWGVQLGWLKGGKGFSRGNMTSGAGGVTSTIRHRSNHDTDWNANLGLMYQAADRVRCGLVVRNINSPTLNFWSNDVVDYDPSVHIGVAGWSSDGRTVGAVDVHNLFHSNGEGAALCLGVEHHVSDGVALRAGLRDGDFTFGAGFNMGGLRLDVATGLPLDEDLTLTASLGY